MTFPSPALASLRASGEMGTSSIVFYEFLTFTMIEINRQMSFETLVYFTQHTYS